MARTVILDGGFATELERRGVPSSGRLWSTRAVVEAPEAVEKLHRDYLTAGADVISTATYQGALGALAREGLDGPKVLKKALEIAQKARDEVNPKARVAASMGPYGAHLADGSEYRGDYLLDLSALTEFHLRQADALVGADILAFETIPSAQEAEAILQALERLGAKREAWISFSARSATHVARGDFGFAEIFALVGPHVDAIGLNCAPPELIEEALLALPKSETKLLVYPNSGETWSALDRAWSGDPGDLATRAKRYVELGAQIVGGCCRTGPEDIARVRRALS